MKKVFSIISGILVVFGVSFLTLFSSQVNAAKPMDNKAGARKIEWNLSSDVMPVPPYGSRDIEGSDELSKLIVNWPNGEVQTNVTGVMKGLNPMTTYTVYLSKIYTPYQKVDITGEWVWTVMGTYTHDIKIDSVNLDGTFTAIGGYPTGEEEYLTEETISGHVSGNEITFTTVYSGSYNPGYTVTVTGTINPDGSITGTSPWVWEAGVDAVTAESGSKGWSSLLPGVESFTFMTDEYGEGSWHYNFMELVEEFSVWINDGATILISDPIVR
ncbi:TPA: hypothetical protein DEP90_00055 [Patescibacteria group bacterium]|nr:hypothetical protein [Patescibacteria group bacterium]